MIEVPVELSDLHGAIVGHTVDVSRGGLLASIDKPRSVGTLLRVRVMGPRNETVMAVGVVVRNLPGRRSIPVEAGGKGVAIALTSTNEAWDRFWDDIGPADRTGSA